MRKRNPKFNEATDETGTKPTRQGLLDLAQSMCPEYYDTTNKQRAARELQRELDNHPLVVKMEKAISKAKREADKEYGTFKQQCNRLKHMVLALGVCKQTLTLAKKLVEDSEKIGLRDSRHEDDDD